VQGATITSITVSLDVPNKDDPKSILYRLKRISTTANTVTNRGLQDLVTAGKETATSDIALSFSYLSWNISTRRSVCTATHYHSITKLTFQNLFSSFRPSFHSPTPLVTIELTRQQSYINSVSVSGQYYRTTTQAERKFRILSFKEQSKVDRLTGTFNKS
jgi:Protein of unknown function (DUF1517)